MTLIDRLIEKLRGSFNYIGNCEKCKGYLHLYDDQENAWKIKDFEALLTKEIKELVKKERQKIIKEIEHIGRWYKTGSKKSGKFSKGKTLHVLDIDWEKLKVIYQNNHEKNLLEQPNKNKKVNPDQEWTVAGDKTSWVQVGNQKWINPKRRATSLELSRRTKAIKKAGKGRKQVKSDKEIGRFNFHLYKKQSGRKVSKVRTDEEKYGRKPLLVKKKKVCKVGRR